MTGRHGIAIITSQNYWLHSSQTVLTFPLIFVDIRGEKLNLNYGHKVWSLPPPGVVINDIISKKIWMS
jgi:hypothetical protein